MGAWGYKTFEDDIACDWLYDLQDAGEPLSFLYESLNPEDFDEYLEYESGCGILGACEVILAIKKGPDADQPEEFRDWVNENKSLDVDKLVPECIKALQRLLSEDSEIKELWEENEEYYPKWKAHVQSLLDALKE